MSGSSKKGYCLQWGHGGTVKRGGRRQGLVDVTIAETQSSWWQSWNWVRLFVRKIKGVAIVKYEKAGVVCNDQRRYWMSEYWKRGGDTGSDMDLCCYGSVKELLGGRQG